MKANFKKILEQPNRGYTRYLSQLYYLYRAQKHPRSSHQTYLTTKL